MTFCRVVDGLPESDSKSYPNMNLLPMPGSFKLDVDADNVSRPSKKSKNKKDPRYW